MPLAEMPHGKDPPEGFVASANNPPVSAEAGPYLGVDWLDGYRQERLVEALSARDDWDRELCRALQLDQTTRVFRDVRDAVLRIPARAARAPMPFSPEKVRAAAVHELRLLPRAALRTGRSAPPKQQAEAECGVWMNSGRPTDAPAEPPPVIRTRFAGSSARAARLRRRPGRPCHGRHAASSHPPPPASRTPMHSSREPQLSLAQRARGSRIWCSASIRVPSTSPSGIHDSSPLAVVTRTRISAFGT